MSNPRFVVHVGAGHATHASADGKTTVCGIERRTDGIVNSHMPYELTMVDCWRCLRRMATDYGVRT